MTLKITTEDMQKTITQHFAMFSQQVTLSRVSSCNCNLSEVSFPHTTQCTQPELKPGKLELGSITASDH